MKTEEMSFQLFLEGCQGFSVPDGGEVYSTVASAGDVDS